jgi:hypothetical protein
VDRLARMGTCCRPASTGTRLDSVGRRRTGSCRGSAWEKEVKSKGGGYRPGGPSFRLQGRHCRVRTAGYVLCNPNPYRDRGSVPPFFRLPGTLRRLVTAGYALQSTPYYKP